MHHEPERQLHAIEYFFDDDGNETRPPIYHYEPWEPPRQPEDRVAPFIGWLRQEKELLLDDLIHAQAVAIAALEQLGEDRELHEIDWATWTPKVTLLRAAEMLVVHAPEGPQLKRFAELLVEFLGRCRLAPRPVRRELMRDIRKATVPGGG